MFSQLAFLKSMRNQYAQKGLKIVLVYKFSYSFGKNWEDIITNFIADHELHNMILLSNTKAGSLSSKYEVTHFPCTFLISKDGYLLKEWKTTALSSELAVAIENDLHGAVVIKHF